MFPLRYPWMPVVFAICCYWISIIPSGTPSCPHPNFVAKHLCLDCLTEEDALEFSRDRNRIQATAVNTVFFGNSSFTSVSPKSTEQLCENDVPLLTYNCNIQRNECRLVGNECKGKHSTDNGHLFYKEVKCSKTKPF